MSNDKPVATSLMQLSKLDKELARRRDLIMVSTDIIVIEQGFNVRGVAMSEDEYWAQEKVQEHIKSLALAYERGDQVPPLVVQFRQEDQKAVIRDGHHRYKAILMAIENGAEINFTPVIEFKGDEQKQQLLMLKSSNSLSLSAVERAEIYQRLYAWGNEPDEIANKVGMSVAHVYQYLKIYNLPMEKKKLIQLGKLSVNAALNETKAPKKFAPPKKAVNKVLELVTSAEVSADDGESVTVKIPKELWAQLIAPSDSAN